jgi:hypothetical protein
MKISGPDLADGIALQASLSAIRKAQTRLNLLTGAPSTPTALASRIELCKILLCEISEIQTSLAANLGYRDRRCYAD